ncbi:MAG: primosomal protein N', partial [Chromohalobacter japonicus]
MSSTDHTPRLLRVALPTPLRRLFDYRPCREVPACGWRPGLRVKVPFGRRQLIGVVVECPERSDVPDAQLKSVLACLDDAPLPDDWWWLCRFT